VFFESIKIMLLGMGTVFLFLGIMVYVTKFMSKMILRYFPEAPKVQPTAAAPKAPVQKTNDNAKIAAILGALQHHHQLEKEGKI
jgi:oxaloacetate decarboxylase (Na+ extruding) subunit gamma